MLTFSFTVYWFTVPNYSVYTLMDGNEGNESS